MVVVTSGAKINGIPRIGFNTIGAPNIIGSLILNKPGKIDNLPKSFKYFDLENIKSTTKASVPPAPPIQTNHCKNCSVKIVDKWVADTPAWNWLLVAIYISQNGLTIWSIIAAPWIPSVEKPHIKNTVVNPPAKLLPTKNPFNGIKILEIKVAILKLNISLTIQNNIKIIAAGKSATKELETSGGTPSGILIVMFFFSKKW